MPTTSAQRPNNAFITVSEEEDDEVKERGCTERSVKCCGAIARKAELLSDAEG